jgi:hypothetical protein
MTYDDIVALVGLEQYQAECAIARRDAERPNYGRGGGGELSSPHEIEELIWEQPVTWSNRIDLFFRIYDDMPAYANLMYADSRYAEFDDDGRRSWWDEVKKRLASSEVALRQPLLYALWCDFFEDADTVEDAWNALTGATVPESVLRLILPISGAVPYTLKRSVYDRLIADPSWHVPIFESLLGSAFDYFGQVEQSDARHVLDRLRLAGDLPGLAELRGKLG